MNQKSSQASWFKKVVIYLSITALVLLVVLGFLLSGAANPILNTYLNDISAKVTQTLGRKVQVESVDLRVFPSFVFHLQNVQLGEMKNSQWGAKREILGQSKSELLYHQDVMHLTSVDVRFNLWKALVSGGKELQVDACEVDGLYINLHRDAEGKFNLQDTAASNSVKKKDAESKDKKIAASKADKSSPLVAKKIRSILQAVELKNVALKNVRVMLIDEQAHAGEDQVKHPTHVLELVKADLFFPTLELARSVEMTFNMVLFGEDNQLSLELSVGPFDQWLASSSFDTYIKSLSAPSQPQQSKKEPLDKIETLPPVEESTEEGDYREIENQGPTYEEATHQNKVKLKAVDPIIRGKESSKAKKVMKYDEITLDFSSPFLSETPLLIVKGQAKNDGSTETDTQSKEKDKAQAQAQAQTQTQEAKGEQEQPEDSKKPSHKNPLDALRALPIPVHIALKSKNVNFAALDPYLPSKLGLNLKQATLDGQFDFHLIPHKAIKSGGTMTFDGLKLRKNKSSKNPKWAKAISFMIAPRADLNLQDNKVSLTDFEVNLNQMSIHVNGQVTQLDQKVPHLNQFKLHTQKFNFSKILQLLPPVAQALPKGMKIAGPISIKVMSETNDTAQKIKSHIDLDQLKFYMPKAISKDAGVPLKLAVDTTLYPKQIKLHSLQLQLSDLNFKAQGSLLKNAKKIELTAQAKPFQIDRLMRLLPSVHDAIPADVKIKGQAALALDVKKNGKNVKVNSDVSLKGAYLTTPDLRLVGHGGVKLALNGDPTQNFQASVDSALSNLDIKVGETFEKPNQVPLEFKLKVLKKGSRIEMPSFNFNIANIKLQGKAQTDAQGKVFLSSRLPQVSLQPVLALLPSLKDSSPGLQKGKVAFDFRLNLNPNSLQKVSVDLKQFSFQSPKNSLIGKVTFENPQSPVIRFDLNADRFSLSEIVPASNSNAAGEKASDKKQDSSQNQSFTMPKIDFIGKANIKKGEALGITFDHFNADIRLQKQVLSFQKMRVNIFEGSMNFHPLMISMPTGKKAQFKGEFDINKIQIASVTRQTMNGERSVKSLMSGSLKLNGKGKTWKEMMPYVYGAGDLQLQKTSLDAFNIEGQILKSLGKKVKKLLKATRKRKKSDTLSFQNVLAQTHIKAGKVHLQKDLRIETDEGPLVLNGFVNLNGKLSLKARWQLKPKVVSRWIGKKIKRKKSIDIKFVMKGAVSDPKVRKVDADSLVKVILKAYGLGKVGKALDELDDFLGGKKKKKKGKKGKKGKKTKGKKGKKGKKKKGKKGKKRKK